MSQENVLPAFFSPEWQARADAEVASRPKQGYRPGPMTPAELELHRQKGAAIRAIPYNPAEVARLDRLISAAAQERRNAAAPHLANVEYR